MSNPIRFLRRLAMPLPDLIEDHREQRKAWFESGEPFHGVTLRRVLHPALIGGMRLLHVLHHQTVTVIGDARIPTGRPRIYAATHIGWDDIEMIPSAIGDHAYLFWGSPKDNYKNIVGVLLGLNGTIICETLHKEDRHISKETSVRWLSQGGNLLIFPEGAWNVLENPPVMPLYTGTAEMALRSGAEIIPLAIEQYGRDFVINIGQNLRPEGHDKQTLTAALRDAMATLRWAIWAQKPVTARRSLPAACAAQYRQGFEAQFQNDCYSLNDIEMTRYHTRAEREQQDAFAHLNALIPRRENAVRLDKRPS